jgi:hypothetical protein
MVGLMLGAIFCASWPASSRRIVNRAAGYIHPRSRTSYAAQNLPSRRATTRRRLSTARRAAASAASCCSGWQALPGWCSCSWPAPCAPPAPTWKCRPWPCCPAPQPPRPRPITCTHRPARPAGRPLRRPRRRHAASRRPAPRLWSPQLAVCGRAYAERAPGGDYRLTVRIAQVYRGNQLLVMGQNSGGDWWYVDYGTGEGWVAADVRGPAGRRGQLIPLAEVELAANSAGAAGGSAHPAPAAPSAQTGVATAPRQQPAGRAAAGPSSPVFRCLTQVARPAAGGSIQLPDNYSNNRLPTRTRPVLIIILTATPSPTLEVTRCHSDSYGNRFMHGYSTSQRHDTATADAIA